MDKKAAFLAFIRNKYNLWREDKIGQSASVRQYARWINVGERTMKNWLDGVAVPDSQKSVSALAAVYGSEIYALLELEPPAPVDDLITPFIALLQQFPPEQRPAVSAAIQQTLQDLLAHPEQASDTDQVMASLARTIIKNTTREGLNPPEVVKK